MANAGHEHAKQQHHNTERANQRPKLWQPKITKCWEANLTPTLEQKTGCTNEDHLHTTKNYIIHQKHHTNTHKN